MVNGATKEEADLIREVYIAESKLERVMDINKKLRERLSFFDETDIKIEKLNFNSKILKMFQFLEIKRVGDILIFSCRDYESFPQIGRKCTSIIWYELKRLNIDLTNTAWYS